MAEPGPERAVRAVRLGHRADQDRHHDGEGQRAVERVRMGAYPGERAAARTRTGLTGLTGGEGSHGQTVAPRSRAGSGALPALEVVRAARRTGRRISPGSGRRR